MINLNKIQSFEKRIFDIIFATMGILVSAPLFLIAGILIKITTPGPIFFTQKRIGRGWVPFNIYKFRTMIYNTSRPGFYITIHEDSRITSIGKLLRVLKIDELPQFINVLRGNMSLVGPRPELPHFIDYYKKDFESILSVRPGMTDLASVIFFNESSLLDKNNHPEEFYIKSILPRKIKISKTYVEKKNFYLDIKIIFVTLMVLISFGHLIFIKETELGTF